VSYTVNVSAKAEKELGAIPIRFRGQIAKKLVQLGEDPRHQGIKKLQGVTGYRERSGDYRILFDIDDAKQTVTVFAIKDRKEAY
jgi:mRNA interferase RelE/StbE